MPTFWQKLQSLLFPVSIRKSSSPVNPVLELFYYHGRYILGAENALYSDGDRYRPLVAACTAPALKPVLPEIRQALVLGTGLASAVHVLRRYGCQPRFTLVELDPLVLDWAMEFLPDGTNDVRPVCSDAEAFIKEDRHSYDLIIIDVFIGREVPPFVTDPRFLQSCRDRLNTGGRVVLNFMVNRPGDETKAKTSLQATFKEVSELTFGINLVYIAV